MPVDPENINSGGLSRAHIIDSVKQSLKRLRTDYVDMLMLNGWDPTVSIHETVRHLNDLVRDGFIRYIGVCDFKGWQLQKFIDSARYYTLLTALYQYLFTHKLF
jgi:aryl-alcohol dehydrogenase-like predicted oxidoreductase